MIQKLLLEVVIYKALVKPPGVTSTFSSSEGLSSCRLLGLYVLRYDYTSTKTGKGINRADTAPHPATVARQRLVTHRSPAGATHHSRGIEFPTSAQPPGTPRNLSRNLLQAPEPPVIWIGVTSTLFVSNSRKVSNVKVTVDLELENLKLRGTEKTNDLEFEHLRLRIREIGSLKLHTLTFDDTRAHSVGEGGAVPTSRKLPTDFPCVGKVRPLSMMQ